MSGPRLLILTSLKMAYIDILSIWHNIDKANPFEKQDNRSYRLIRDVKLESWYARDPESPTPDNELKYLYR